MSVKPSALNVERSRPRLFFAPFATFARHLFLVCAFVIAHGPLSIPSATAADQSRSDPADASLSGSFASRFIGAWKLIAIRERDSVTGAEITAARPGIGGQLIYTPNGRLSVQIVREGREKAAAGSSDGFSSYFGTWKLLPDEGCVVHQQEWNINHAQSGVPAKRYYSFNDLGHLSLATPPRKREADNKEIQMVFVWTRLP